RRFLLTCVQRNRNHQLRLKALTEIAALRDPDAFDDSVEVVATWPREERRAGAKVLLEALVERRIGRRDQAQAWVWRLAAVARERLRNVPRSGGRRRRRRGKNGPRPQNRGNGAENGARNGSKGGGENKSKRKPREPSSTKPARTEAEGGGPQA